MRGVLYVNDTTATAPAATIAALEAFSPTASTIILIAGGSDKGLDMTDMARTIAKHAPRSFFWRRRD